MENYRRLGKLGEGTYGVVYKYQHKGTGEFVALKRIRIIDEDEGVPRNALREISILREVTDHPNIVGLKDVIMEEEDLYMVFDCLPMDLNKYIDSYGKDKQLEITTVKSLTYQLLRGLRFCHERRVMHRDLKPENLLIDLEGNLKIADFGLARTVEVPVRPDTHEVGTLWYKAPELLLRAPLYSFCIDMWSVGCIMAELVTKEPLFPGDSVIDQLFRLFSMLKTPTEDVWPGVSKLPDYIATFPKLTELCLKQNVGRLGEDKDGMNLLSGLLTYSPSHRMSAKSAIMHPFFDDFDKKQLPVFDDLSV